MNIFIEKHKEILSEDSTSSVSSHFTWGEGNVVTETMVTTYHAQLTISIYCDNVSLYRSLGGQEDTITREYDNAYFPSDGDTVFDFIDGIQYTGLKLIDYGPAALISTGRSKRKRQNSWLCLEEVIDILGDNEYRYRIINRAQDLTGLTKVRSVMIHYTYQTIEHNRY